MRKNNYDLLRILSSIAVVLLHVNFYFFQSIVYCPSISLEYIVGSIINIVTRFSVPVFVMLSGVFVLDRKIENKKLFYKKTIIKLGIPYMSVLLIWYIVYFIRYCIKSDKYAEYIGILVDGGIGNLWFMPMIIMIYFLVPFIQPIIKSLKTEETKFVVFIFLIWAIGSQAITDTKVPYAISVVFAWSAYFLLGWYLEKNIIKIKRRYLYAFCGFIVGTEFIIRYFLGNMYPVRYMVTSYTNFFEPLIVMFAIAVFLIFRDTNIKIELKWLADKTYYIYLLHSLFLEIITAIIGDKVISNKIGVVFVVTIIIYILSLIFAIVLEFIFKRKNVVHEP